MTARLVQVPNFYTLYLTVIKYAVALALLALPVITQATPINFGSFKIDQNGVSEKSAKGTYETDAGATGTFELTRYNNYEGYNGVTFKDGNNGIEILHHSDTNEDQDEFSYKFKITPDDKNSIHTIKIGQASYATTGNSDIGRLELEYYGFDKNEQVDFPMKATIRNNPSVPYSYDTMGDYFMGKKGDGTTLRSGNCTNNVTYPKEGPQLRSKEGDHDLYYYKIEDLKGSGDKCGFIPEFDNNNKVSYKVSEGRELPNGNKETTFAKLLKSSNNPNSYEALSTGEIANQFKFVRYGVANTNSKHVIAIENAGYVTIEFEGIMQNHRGSKKQIDGETGDEWISFGVESRLVNPVNYSFSGTVFNDNGGMDDSQADPLKANGTPYDNSDYFNGKLDSGEVGISGSTVKVVNCDTDESYNPQTVVTIGDSIGNYEITVPIATLKGKTAVCLTESHSAQTYPIRTNNSKKTISLVKDQYVYPDNNFGRVVADNAALVLEKRQYVHTCTPTLDYSTVNDSTDATTGFSMAAASNVAPNKCIAYKITATNRSNLSIDNIIIKDALQAGDSNNTATSQLAKPERVLVDFNDELTTGDTGTIKTKAFALTAKKNRVFYFNTTYVSPQSN